MNPTAPTTDVARGDTTRTELTGPLVRVHVQRGDPALARISGAPWDDLVRRCPWATRFQARDFLRTWFGHYGDRYEPLLVVGEDAEDRLVAALPLAVCDGQVVVAGTHHAEYHAWLSTADESDAFLSHAFAALDGLGFGGVLTFRYLNPGAPLADWLATDPRADRVVVETVGRSLLDVDDPERGVASLRKKGNRSKLNRLKRMGPLSFERIRDPHEFARTLHEAIPFYDLRQGGAHDAVPFAGDDRKEALHRALFELPDFLHVTAMRVGDRLVSALFGFRYDDAVGVGVFAHDPRLAAHSPGKLHLLQLAGLLAEEGLSTLDLTPGEGWKQRFASREDRCRILRYHFRRRDAAWLRARRRLEDVARRGAHAVGTTPDDVREELGRWRQAPLRNLVQLPGRVLRRLHHDDALHVYSRTPRPEGSDQSTPTIDGGVRVDDLAATLAAARTTGLLRDALTRLEAGATAYVGEGDLDAPVLGWVHPAPVRHVYGPGGRRLPLLPGTAVVELSSGGDPAARRAVVRCMLHDIDGDPRTRRIRWLPTNPADRDLAVELGFAYEYTSTVRRRWGRRTHTTARWPDPTGPDPLRAVSLGTRVKRGVYHAARWLGLFHLARRLTARELRILCYHGFSLEGESTFYPRLFMDPDTFEDRMQLLVDDGYPVVGLDDAVRGLDDGTLPDAAVVLTIDDGPYSVPAKAAPVLKRLGLPATVYQTTYYTDHREPVFRMACQYLVWRSDRESVSLDGLVEGVSGRLELSSDAHFDPALWEVIHAAERDLDENGRVAVGQELGRRLGVDWDLLAESRLIGLADHGELARMLAAGIDVQLHTHRHRFPADRAVVEYELRRNRESLAALPVTELAHLCYPSNEWYPEQLPWLRELGIRSGTTCETGMNPPGSEPLLLRRFLDGECVAEIEFLAELSGFADLLRRALGRGGPVVRE